MQDEPVISGDSSSPDTTPLSNWNRLKPGPVARPGTRVTNVVLDGDAADWAKEQPGGLSETLRRLLREEMERSLGKTAGSADAS